MDGGMYRWIKPFESKGREGPSASCSVKSGWLAPVAFSLVIEMDRARLLWNRGNTGGLQMKEGFDGAHGSTYFHVDNGDHMFGIAFVGHLAREYV